jgi:hypothetical protein
VGGVLTAGDILVNLEQGSLQLGHCLQTAYNQLNGALF